MRVLLIILISISTLTICTSQKNDSLDYEYLVLSKENTNKLKEEIKYDKTKNILVPREWNKKKKNDPKEIKPFSSFKGLEDIFSAIMYVIAALFILTIIYFIIIDIKKNKVGNLNKKVMELEDFDVDDITAIDFDPLLDEALRQGNYRIAVRIKFLRILQKLQLNNLIDWKPNKTNRKYALEISDMDLKSSFRSIANIFDRLWYGNISINKEEYEYCNSLFENFTAKLK